MVSGSFPAFADETKDTAGNEALTASENDGSAGESSEAESDPSADGSEAFAESSEEPTEESTEEPAPPVPQKPYTIPYSVFSLYPEEEDIDMLTVRDCLDLYMREGPGYEYDELAHVQKAMPLRVLGEEYSEAGGLWYKVDAGIVMEEEEIIGYLDADDCKVVTLKPGDDAYGIYLRQLGFPEAYIPELKALHEEYPDWIFVAHDTGLYWSDVLWEESNPPYYPGISLIHPYQISSWKSIKPGHYDWATSTYTAYDGNWNAASEGIVAYFLDPRNFLDDSAVFLFLDQRFNESQTVEGVEQIVAGTFMAEPSVTDVDGTVFYYPQAIYDIGKKLGVSPYFLACCIRQEIGVAGTSKSISGTSIKYPGFYNYFNVYAFTTPDEDANDHGLWFASGQGIGATSYNRPWNTRLKGMTGGAMYLGNNYILVGQNTLYYKRFNVTNQSAGLFRHQYMTNVMGAYSEAVSLSRAYGWDSRQQALVFDIPYYYQMPETPCEQPTVDGSPNNKLAGIKPGKYKITPAFDMDTAKYNVIIDDGTSSIKLKLTPCDAAASLKLAVVPADSGKKTEGGEAPGTEQEEKLDWKTVKDGSIKLTLKEGTTEYRIKVTAENGDVRYYTLVIYCELKQTETMKCVYPVSPEGYMSGIRIGTQTDEFIANLGLSSGLICSLKNADGSDKEAGTVMKTGDTVDVRQGEELFFTGQVLIYGDVNGDGKINIFDILDIRDSILDVKELSEIKLAAANVTKDKKINIFDILDVRDHILGLKEITQ